MEQIATLSFKSPDKAETAWIVIRAKDGLIGLAVSLETDGDVEVFLGPDDCRRIVDALRDGVKRAERRPAGG